MKRVIALLLSCMLLASASVGIIPVSAADASGSPENFADGLVWNKSVGTPSVTKTDTGAVMKGLANSWDSAGVDILPALKKALGDGDGVMLTLSVSLKASMKSGSEKQSVQARPLLRGTSPKSGLGDEAWNSLYAQSIGGDFSLFGMFGGNIMSLIGDNLILTHGEWITYTTTLDLTRKQVECDILTEWIFCVDNLGGMDLSMVDSIEFKDLVITAYTGAPDTDKTPTNNDHLITSYRGEVWSPVEIILWSSKDYHNPYVDTTIDAVFTHSDGTKITLPGFWMEGNTWAVRFSPTKVGKWSYTITCADASNEGLFKSGIIVAGESTKDNDVTKHGFVTTQKDTHYYTYADGTPFFWLGDTNWQGFTNLSTTICNYPGCTCGSQFKHIVDDRVEKGFTVYQTYFVPEGGNGEKSLWLDNGHKYPDTDVFNDKVDEMFEYLHGEGLVIALGLGCHTSTMSSMKLEDLLRFTRYVVARYACYSVVWISGQEITDNSASATPGYSAFECYMEASSLIEELDGYGHPNSAHMYPMVIEDERATRLDKEAWHDSWTLQNGHCVIQPVDFYKGYYEARITGVIKPFVEGEANYEDINCGGFTGYDLNRNSAWYAMLSGAAGFTYGTTGIWASSFSTDTYTGWLDDTSSFSYDPWYMGLDKPGSFEVSYMKDFFTAIGPWYDLIPQFDDSAAASFLKRGQTVLAMTEDASLAVAYFYNTRTDSTGTIRNLDDTKAYDAYWYNPRTGKYIPVAKGVHSEDGCYTLPSRPDKQDWVFLLTALGLGVHYEENLPTDLNPSYEQVAPTGTPVTPVSVEAVGGITYKGIPKKAQVMTDNTAWLYDGDPTTVWTPFSNRSTQTFLFDLGTPQKLTHITITPAEGTIIPTFRVYGSNDGELWTILVDTEAREYHNPGAGSEPLQGTYRYVKILLLNAESVKVGEDKVNTLGYEAMFNPASGDCYSVTRISDVTLYSDGEGTPTPDKLVDPNAPVEEETDPADGIDTTAPENQESETSVETDPSKKGCRSSLSTTAALALTACAAAVWVGKKKED